MKKQDIPQDESNLQSANMTEMLYVTDENNNYTTAQSIGWEAKKAALDESMELINERIEEAKQKSFTGIVWQVLNWNGPAINFYKKYNAKFDDEWVNCSMEIQPG